MAGADRDPRADLIARLARDPAAADFFQAVRVLTHAPLREGSAEDGGGEAVRLRAAQGLRHASTEIVAAEPGTPPRLTVGFMGLTGPSGVLPDHYTELLVAQRRAREAGAQDFLDLFDHRLLGLFHRAWAKYRLPASWEDARRSGAPEPFAEALAALMGLGLPAQRGALAGAGATLLTLAGPLSRRVRSARAVRSVAAVLTELPAEVRELQGAWIPIAPQERTRLGAGPGAFSQLGRDAVAGARAYDVQGRVRVRLGPMGAADFRSFFRADGPRAGLHRGLRSALGGAVDYELQLVLRREEIPPLRLAATGEDPPLLGQTTWMCAAPPARDRDDAVLSSGPGPAPVRAAA